MLDTNLNTPFCHSSIYVHAEVNRALRKDLTMDEFLKDEHIPNHNFRPEFTHEQITVGKFGYPRYHHDVCHALLAIAYKKMGVDTTKPEFWYNGNEYAEGMVIAMEAFFFSLFERRSMFTEESYLRQVGGYFDFNRLKKEELRREIAVMISDESPYPRGIFEICRESHFEIDFMKYADCDESKDDLSRTRWGEQFFLPIEISDDHIREVYRTLKPIFDYLENLLEPNILTPFLEKELPRMHETLKNIKMRDLWSAITKELHNSPMDKPSSTPSLL